MRFVYNPITGNKYPVKESTMKNREPGSIKGLWDYNRACSHRKRSTKRCLVNKNRKQEPENTTSSNNIKENNEVEEQNKNFDLRQRTIYKNIRESKNLLSPLGSKL